MKIEVAKDEAKTMSSREEIDAKSKQNDYKWEQELDFSTENDCDE